MELKNIFENENEKPLDAIPEDGGYTAIFRTIACVGDSLSSGEFEANNGNGGSSWHDMYEYSWGQFLGRACGSKVYNLSRGGMSAKEYCDTFADANGYWNPKYAAQCYIMALGVNDLLGLHQRVGSCDDINSEDPDNRETFAYYYAKIIERYKKIQPRAKFFLMTMPRESSDDDNRRSLKIQHRELLHSFAEKYDNTYVLDLFEYAPEYDEKFKENFYLRGHMNPQGYLLTAKMTAAYIDYIIRHNMRDFKETGFIGTDLHE